MKDNTIIKEMTEEDIENLTREYNLVAKLSGFESGEAMDNFKVNASCGLIKFGGSFAQPLGEALAHADYINTAKILRTFRKECHEHAMLYVKWLEQRDKTI